MIKSAWAYRNGQQILSADLRAVREAKEAAKQAVDTKSRGESLKRMKRAREEAWEALAPGDSLAAFGHPHIVVAKKNRRSVITTTGGKFTAGELI